MSENKETASKEATENKEAASGEVKASETSKKETSTKKKKKKPSSNSEGKKKIKILADNLAGKYMLPWNKGQEVEMESKQADELIKAKDAEEVK